MPKSKEKPSADEVSRRASGRENDGTVRLSGKTVFAVVVLAVLITGTWFGMRHGVAKKKPRYAVVTLVTGEVYFGKIDWFPWPRLKGTWVLRREQGPDGGTTVAVVPLRQMFWEPEETVYLNPKAVAAWSYLREGSRIEELLKQPEGVATGE